MNGKRTWGWLTVLSQWVVLTSAAALISVACIWSGFKLWCFYKQPPAPKKPDSSSSCPLERPAKKETLPEGGAFASLKGGSQGITGTPRLTDTEIQVLDWEYKKALISAKKALIRESSARSETIEREFDKMRGRGVTQAEIKNDPIYPQLDEEHDIRTPLFSDIYELRKEMATLEEAIPEIKKRKIEEQAVRKHRRLPRRPLLRASSSCNHNPWNIHPNPRNLDLRRNQSPGSSDSSDSDSLRISSGE